MADARRAEGIQTSYGASCGICAVVCGGRPRKVIMKHSFCAGMSASARARCGILRRGARGSSAAYSWCSVIARITWLDSPAHISLPSARHRHHLGARARCVWRRWRGINIVSKLMWRRIHRRERRENRHRAMPSRRREFASRSCLRSINDQRSPRRRRGIIAR